MNKLFFSLVSCFLLCLSAALTAQTKVMDLEWKQVASGQPKEWYGSAEAVGIAENVLLYQRNVGGWPKNTPFHHPLTQSQKDDLRKLQAVGEGATTDNGATCTELTFLSKIYERTKNERYNKAFLRGIDYLLEAQYENGGWPQFYPQRKGYYTHITYNDNSMVNIMNVIKAIAEKSAFYSIVADDATVTKARKAFEKGVKVILKTQYKQDGKLTVWCAQHDETTFQPAKARSYELPSLSGGESPGVVLLLMGIDKPTPEIVNAVQAAVIWFDKAKIGGIRMEAFVNSDGLKDRKIVADKAAPFLWARFNELDNNRPFFCDRDGIKKYALSEIGYERRNGYSWYTTGPQKVLDAYKKWQMKWAPEKNVLSN
jgi:pectinesterase